MLRPLRLVRLVTGQLEDNRYIAQSEVENGDVRAVEDVNELQGMEGILSPVTGEAPVEPVPGADNGSKSGKSGKLPGSEIEARHLLRRTPNSYLLNQVYGLWVFISLFLLTVIVTRKVSVVEYGVYAVVMAAFNTIAYIVAFGLEDATTTFVPRVFAEHGRASAANLIRRLLALRIVILSASAVIMLFGMPVLANIIDAIPISGTAAMASSMRDPQLIGHIAPIAVYVVGNGISSLFTSVCAALMRMRFVFIAGSIAQFAILALSFIVLQMGWGIDGVLWVLAVISLLTALAFVAWLAPMLFLRGESYRQSLKPVLDLGLSAWLTNLVSGALLKQVSIILLGYFAISLVEIGYFNLSFQLAHAASLLLVSGFGGVGVAALAAAYVGHNSARLARAWQALIKIETLLAAPGLVFCLFNAQNVAHALYGSSYDPVGPLLAIFLFFNILVRVLGTTIHNPRSTSSASPGWSCWASGWACSPSRSSASSSSRAGVPPVRSSPTVSRNCLPARCCSPSSGTSCRANTRSASPCVSCLPSSLPPCRASSGTRRAAPCSSSPASSSSSSAPPSSPSSAL